MHDKHTTPMHRQATRNVKNKKDVRTITTRIIMSEVLLTPPDLHDDGKQDKIASPGACTMLL